MHIALFQPQIPPNTGNIIRLCANTGAHLHIIHPTGFGWDDKRLKRAGLDYAEFAEVCHYENWAEFAQKFKENVIWALTTRGKTSVFNAQFSENDVLLFGSETAGLSEEVHSQIPLAQKLRLPMQANSRSLNLSNSVAIVLYEALRQTGLPQDSSL
ncbi:tRNA (cytidine(34)-2'-O)-methyltransferase [Suttonella ornithocola]|uniref:tRNA (cytidine(34)-2'-O)-methyltransferase n=1 Tax=Suttonella ornithocola TaxID=279832 RepID=A0A380MUE6_9GAMM|nr:tRNA (cytidine(34)-2'-O)-methyltransferase [Suttonella ornithocola]SUO95804.1 tRNA (cytidine(34)-2'-O)-methyltransferase [Suttonella ornithocola]